MKRFLKNYLYSKSNYKFFIKNYTVTTFSLELLSYIFVRSMVNVLLYILLINVRIFGPACYFYHSLKSLKTLLGFVVDLGIVMPLPSNSNL